MQPNLGNLEWQVTCIAMSCPRSPRNFEVTHKFDLDGKIDGTNNANLILENLIRVASMSNFNMVSQFQVAKKLESVESVN